VARRLTIDLLAQPTHEHIDGPVAVRLPSPPHLLEELVPRHDATAVEGEHVEQPELGWCQLGTLAIDECLHFPRIDAQFLDLDRVSALLLLRTNTPPRRGTHSCDKFSHGERLDEVVVGADLERVNAIVFGAPCRHDDDRRANSFGARGLDQLPPVELRQHQIENTDIGVLEPQPREAKLAPSHDDRVEAGSNEVLGHPVRDHIVVFNDQDPGHTPTIDLRWVLSGFRNGDYLVYDRSFDELRTGFTAAVSHELRTPLARILALLDSADLPGADVRDLIEQAKAEVENAGVLIDEVLFLSELESGKEVVSLGHTAALPVLQEVVRQFAGAAERAGVELEVLGDPTVEVPLRPRMLRMVAENLTENAVRYAGHGARFSLSAQRAGDFAVLAAADDGAGVDEVNLDRLFERFYRADAARTSRGTGLGLAIVKHVVAAAGGDIEADGGLGRGLRIRCTFPA
jgi:Histidine kinase-, DNA gyrase B-, and HSP90-like ATPase/His Kinase A (phospho-acceptor) domain